MPTCEWLVISPMVDIMWKHYNSKNPIRLNAAQAKWNSLVNPPNKFRVLDVGCGNGKYGMLLREYLDGCWYGRRYEDPTTWRCEIIAVEPFERYISPAHEFHYDRIIVAPIEQIVKDGYFDNVPFDIILLSDIIEHLTKEEGIQLLLDLKKWMKPDGIILISTPDHYFHQGNVDGCAYEEHKCCWSVQEFEQLEGFTCQNYPKVNTTLIVVLRKK